MSLVSEPTADRVAHVLAAVFEHSPQAIDRLGAQIDIQIGP